MARGSLLRVTTMNTPSRTPSRLVVTAGLAVAITLGAVWLWCGDRVGAAPAPATRLDKASAPIALAVEPHDAPTRTEALARDGYYTAPVGTTLTCTLGGRFEYGVAPAEGSRQISGFQVSSALDLQIVDRRRDELAVKVELRGFSLSPLAGGAGADDGGLGRAVQRPFWVRLGTDGAVHGYRFAEELTGEQRNFVRGVFSAYMHAVPADAQGTWEANDVDAAGTLIASFRLEAGRDADATSVERHKLRYTAMAGDEIHPHEFTGGSRATFSRALGWLRGVDVDERTTLRMDELGLAIEARTVLAITLVEASVQRESTTAAWDEAWLPAGGHTEDLVAGAEAHDRARWSKLLERETLVSLTNALAALLVAEPQDAEAIDKAWLAIQWLVRLRPETAREIQARVAAGMDAHLGRMLLSALGGAGTIAAQDVLAALRADASLPGEVRTAATMALFQLAAPSPRVLGDLTRDLGGAREFTGDDALAMLLLGALAPRAGEARIEGRSALDVLLGFEAQAADQGRLDLWLDALGNTGSEAVVAHAGRFVAHPDDAVRAAAYHALRRVPGAASLALLERGFADPSPAVRADVVAALGQHDSATARALLGRAARDDADADVRRASVAALARFATPGTAARQTLEFVAQSDPDATNRSQARGFLAGGR